MNQKKNYEKLTNSEKKQIKDFMEWGTGKNDINSWGMPEQMTMHEKIRYAILFTIGILFLSILERKTVNCIVIVGIDVLMISILLIFAKKKIIYLFKQWQSLFWSGTYPLCYILLWVVHRTHC